MVPREAGRGSSFKGAGAYYLHDPGASTQDRVQFTHTENIPTEDPDKALKWMAWTAMHADELKRESGVRSTGRPCTKPVFTFSLSWHPEEQPKKWDMIRAGRTALVSLGLQDHETLMVSHTDRPHPHIHLIVNVIHPETGKVNNLPYSRKKLSEWAEAYEREHGKIYCAERVENNARRAEGEYVKHQQPEHDLKARVSELYRQSDSGAAFQAGLKELGLTLAQGNRLVLIDGEGNIHSLSRQIDGAKAKEVRAKLADLKLPDVDTVRAQQAPAAEPEPSEAEPPVAEPTSAEHIDRDQQDQEWQESIIDTGIAHDASPRPQPPQLPPRREVPSHLLKALQDRHLAELGQFYNECSQARHKLAATMEKQYGAHERQLRHDIAHLENTLKNSGPIRRWWLTITKQIPKNADQELENMRLTLGNIEWRKSEAHQAVTHQTEIGRHDIETKHEQERLEHATRMASEPAPRNTCDENHDPTQDGPSIDN